MFRSLVLTLIAAACSAAVAQTNEPARPRENAPAAPAGPVSTNPNTIGSIGSAAGQAPYYVGIQQGFARESNPNLAIEGQPKLADTYSTTTLRAGIRQPISRQSFFGDAEFRYRRYSERTNLSGTGYTVNGGLDFATVNRISGTIGATFTRDQPRGVAATTSGSSGGFGLGSESGEVGIAKSEELRGVGRIGGVTPLTLELGADYRQVSYSKAPSLDYKQPRATASASYRLSSATSLGAGVSVARPEYADDSGKRTDVFLQGTWIASALSDVQGRIAQTKFTREVRAQNNYKGLSGSLTWNWRPTGKIAMATILARDTGQDIGFLRLTPQFTVAAAEFSRVTNLASVRASYEATAKVFLDVGLSHSRAITVNQIANTREGRRSATVFSLGARWLPTRNLTFGCQYSRDNQDNLTYRLDNVTFDRFRPVNDVFGCLGAYTFF